jgi:protein phosphatase
MNPEGESVCHKCGARLPHRYLWVLGLEPEADKTQTALVERYRFRGPQVVIDTQPGLPLASAFDITDDILPYLKLFSLRLHLPQIYSLLPAHQTEEPESSPLILLEGAPLAPTDLNAAEFSKAEDIHKIAVAEDFTVAWKGAAPLRQISWLWQIAQLWVPLQREGVAASLVDSRRLRVEGPLLRLMSLDYHPDSALPLSELGRFWAKWCLPAAGRWQARLTELCDRLMEADITTAEQLIEDLETWLTAARASTKIQISVATRTDSGPTRDHNEDACYPIHGTVTQNTQEGLMIVCDGVGGHEGGEVASGIAIQALTEHLKQTQPQQISAEEVIRELETAVGIANDQIAQQNDRENRHDRDRMGTTAVMALVQNQDLYLANVGDSRAYLITPQACYQLTTDDDIATREVRLGYLPYREALRQPGAGSLIQALGMVPSSMLRPSTLRLPLDSDCLFLLCSDGLSDFERVESLWRDELLPLLHGEIDLAEATKNLISAANRLNGHDNVTVALLQCKKTSLGADSANTALEQLPIRSKRPTLGAPSASRSLPRMGWPFIGWIVGILALFGVGAALAFLFRQPTNSTTTEPSSQGMQPTASLVPTGAATITANSTILAIGSYWTVQPDLIRPTAPTANPTEKLSLRAVTAQTAESSGRLEPGTVLKILGTQQNKNDPASWLKVQVCTLPANASSGTSSADFQNQAPVAKINSRLKPGQIGYIEASLLSKQILQADSQSLSIRNAEGCSTAASSPTIPPSP